MGHPVYGMYPLTLEKQRYMEEEDVSQLNHCLLFIIAKSGSFHPYFSPLFFHK